MAPSDLLIGLVFVEAKSLDPPRLNFQLKHGRENWNADDFVVVRLRWYSTFRAIMAGSVRFFSTQDSVHVSVLPQEKMNRKENNVLRSRITNQ